jgi:hypothetical protein
VLRAIVPPLVAAYAAFVAMVIVVGRRPVSRTRPRPDGRLGVRSLVATIAGGYVAFLAIVLIFHVWLAGERAALAEAVWGGAFLAGIALATGAASTFAARRD